MVGAISKGVAEVNKTCILQYLPVKVALPCRFKKVNNISDTLSRPKKHIFSSDAPAKLL
jgi:hypothetical protein